MRIGFTQFIETVSRATDFVEAEILNIPSFHENRVAVMVHHMAARLGMDPDTVYAMTMAGALHDCALSEYLNDEFSEKGYNVDELNMASHCVAGERMLKVFPFYHRVTGAVLHHHDRADGTGALGTRAEETPIYGQLLHIADMADAVFSLNEMDREKYGALLAWIDAQEGAMFSPTCCKAFKEAVTYDVLTDIVGSGSVEALEKLLPDVEVDVSVKALRELATFLAHITDYKSHFTWKHSLGIAEKAERIGEYYGYDEELRDKLYIAGALHDIGKLLIPNDILEKPGKLTPEEYKEITNHALGTWDMLHGISGLEDITRWAALHHEKLDGSGYPFGYTAEQLGKHERLLACLDIYQALVEERPYKAGMPHNEAMGILRKMGAAGQLDLTIIGDIDACHGMHCAGAFCEIRQETPVIEFTGAAWRCPVCGYVYEGELPKDFICPRCEQPASIFERL